MRCAFLRKMSKKHLLLIPWTTFHTALGKYVCAMWKWIHKRKKEKKSKLWLVLIFKSNALVWTDSLVTTLWVVLWWLTKLFLLFLLFFGNCISQLSLGYAAITKNPKILMTYNNKTCFSFTMCQLWIRFTSSSSWDPGWRNGPNLGHACLVVEWKESDRRKMQKFLKLLLRNGILFF